MADDEQLRILKEKGVGAWNEWRKQAPNVLIDLLGANLRRADLIGVDLVEADLTGAILSHANLARAHLNGAHLGGAALNEADLSEADLTGAHLDGADLRWASLMQTHLADADLSGAQLIGANLIEADLTRAHLRLANLEMASLVLTNLTGADLSGSTIFGVSAWGLKLSDTTKQRDLVVRAPSGLPGYGVGRFDDQTIEPQITVDNIEVAQFIYLLLHNPKVRDVIDTITSKAVLILGRFTEERKAVLEALREELRKRNYLPILFDFDKPDSKDLTGTVTTLANMARFIIADGTDPKSIPHELATIVPSTIVPVKPILLKGEREYAMFSDLKRRYRWVLPTYRYTSQQQLIADLDQRVIRPAAEKAEKLRKTVAA